MQTKALKISWIIMVVITGLVVLLGALLAFTPTFFIANEFEMYTGQKLAAFAESNPEAYAFLMLEDSEMGLFMMTIGILSVLITVALYRKGNRLAWYLLLISSTLTAGGTVGFNVVTGDIRVILLPAVMLVISWASLAIGAKAVFRGVSS